ncbi:type III pantothenate kinase [Tenacibaculum sp. UWU-22]|uniref:type III pantothenate kinase n=1 Tax=Tenacibaculum sp. UWU-22 TaxID=3234187 RepID=UPI0034DB655F
MNLIIDVGNTRVKAAVFQNNALKQVLVFNKSKIISEVKTIVKKYAITDGIISSVGNITNSKQVKLNQLLPLIDLNAQTKVPFKNLYSTPTTLGVDRIALAAAAVNKFPKKNVLVIDAGTCVTFDFINKDKTYLGGAISPGIRMRYKALHVFTSKLPMLETGIPESFIGNSTKTAIDSGVVNGICNEIDGVIEQYKKKYPDLTLVLTGGDANFLAKQLKSVIFATPNFILEGLYAILIHNKEE